MTFKIHVKKGDTVQCIAGVDKGKVGVVQKVRNFMVHEVCMLQISDGADVSKVCCAQVLPKTGQLIVENINVKVSEVGPHAWCNSVLGMNSMGLRDLFACLGSVPAPKGWCKGCCSCEQWS